MGHFDSYDWDIIIKDTSIENDNANEQEEKDKSFMLDFIDKNDDVLKQRQMQHMWDNQIYNGKRPDLNSKRSKERFDWNDKHEWNAPIEIADTDDGENAAKEFFNRPFPKKE